MIRPQLENFNPAVTPSDDTRRPTVIFLMSESFFDLTAVSSIVFEDDPIPRYHALAEEFTSGKIVTNTYAGGTAYVEMEVLTGICNALLAEKDNLTSLPEDVYNRMPTISDIFAAYGYQIGRAHV